jgi:hypothetical protein
MLTFVPVMSQPPESAAPFDAYRKLVLGRPALLEQLRAAPDVTASSRW